MASGGRRAAAAPPPLVAQRRGRVDAAGSLTILWGRGGDDPRGTAGGGPDAGARAARARLEADGRRHGHLRVATTFHDPSGLRVVGCWLRWPIKIWPAEISLSSPACAGLRARNEHLDELTRLDLARGHSRRRRAGE